MSAGINTQSDLLNSMLANDKKHTNIAELLKAKFAAAPNSGVPADAGAPNQDSFAPTAQAIRTAAMSQQYQQSYTYSQTMTMSLTTQEGDQVQVDFRQLYAEYQAYKKESGAEDGPSGVRYFDSTEELEATAFEERFGFSVQGDLNEDELKAVFDVFESVDKLANEFFNGDVETAFQKAQSLQIDFSQLKNFSLDLQKTETFTAAYQETQSYQDAVPEQTSEQAQQNITELPAYLQQWQNVIEKMSAHFEDARARFDELMSETLAQRYGDSESENPALSTDSQGWLERIKAFHDQFASAAGLDKDTLKPSGVEVTPVDYDPEVALDDKLAQANNLTADTTTKQGEIE